MGKDKSKKKGKNKSADTKVDAAMHGLSKKERKALEHRAAELEAELAAKALKKAAKAGKGKPDAEPAAEPMTKAERDAKAPKPAKKDKAPKSVAPEASNESERVGFLLGIINDLENNSQNTRDKARRELEQITGEAEPEAVEPPPLADDGVAERVKAKRLLRKAGLMVDDKVDADAVPRDDKALVDAYNLVIGMPNGKLITSTEELDKTLKATKAPPAAASEAESAPHAEEVPSKPRKVKAGDELVVEIDGETLAEPVAPEVVEVATEEGRIFASGEAEPDDDFANPSEAAPQLEEGRNGYKIIMLDKDGKPDPKVVRQMTRVTTYIDNLEDKTNLETWKMRTLLEGIAIDTLEGDGNDYLATVHSLMHTRDIALAKARKADRKGKLEAGELAELETAATKAFKDAVNAIAHEALEVGGVHEKANKGTNLHALAELYDAEGMGPINEKLKAGDITKTDHASIVAYAEALINSGIKVLEAEVVVVSDTHKRAGRLDRIVLAKFPGSTRAIRCIADIKSGQIQYGVGKLAQQLEAYADSKGYDLETGERRDLKVSKTKGLVIHLPQGTGECFIYPVDLTLGAKGNKLSGEVRAWRNESKKAVDFTVDLAHPVETVEAAS